MRFAVAALSSVLFTFADGKINEKGRRDEENLTKIRHEVSTSSVDETVQPKKKHNEPFDSSSPDSSSFSKVTQTDVYKKLQDRLIPNKLKNPTVLPEEKCVLTKANKSKQNRLDFGALAGTCASKNQLCVDPELIGMETSSEEGVGFCVDRASIPESYWDAENNNDPGSYLLIDDPQEEEEEAIASQQSHTDEEEHRRRLQAECNSICPDRPKVLANENDFYYQIRACLGVYDVPSNCKYTDAAGEPININCWDTSQVTNMVGAFFTNYYSEYTDLFYFNQDLQCWDVSNVENMDSMFYAATKFNGNIDSWDTSKVTDMQYMFNYASEFNRPIGSWNVAKVQNMTKLFAFAQNETTGKGFNQNIKGWKVNKVLSMYGMFESSKFNGDINKWKPKLVKNTEYMFDTNRVFNQKLTKFGKNLGKVTSMMGMFYGATSFKGKGGLKKFKTGKVKDMTSMFSEATAFTGDGVEKFDVRKVTSMYAMFYNATSFEGKKLAKWNTKEAIDMASMFEKAKKFGKKKNPQISTWDVRKVKYFDYMFMQSGFNRDVNPWNPKKMENGFQMFADSPFNQCLSTWGSKVPASGVNASDMFTDSQCPNQANLVPGGGPSCQGPAQDCFEQTFENTCQNKVPPYSNELDQRCNKECSNIGRKEKFSNGKKINCGKVNCDKQVSFLDPGITFANFCAKKCATCLNFGKE